MVVEHLLIYNAVELCRAVEALREGVGHEGEADVEDVTADDDPHEVPSPFPREGRP